MWARIIGTRRYSAVPKPIYNSLIPNNNGYRQMAQRHIFVIGCSRSGTSLVQKKIAEYCGLWTLPETEFFLEDLDRLRGRLHALVSLYRAVTDCEIGYRDAVKVMALGHFARHLGPRRMLAAVWSRRGAEALFSAYFSHQARMHVGCDAWVEKTPRHFMRIDMIRAALPGAKFLFVLRRGEDVVASILDRHAKWPERFPGQGDPRYGVDLWNHAFAVIQRVADDDDVMIVDYEYFVSEHELTLRAVAAFLGRFDARGGDVSRRVGVTRRMEAWKATLDQPLKVHATPLSRFLTPEQVAQVQAALHMEGYARLVESARTRLRGRVEGPLEDGGSDLAHEL